MITSVALVSRLKEEAARNMEFMSVAVLTFQSFNG